MVNQVTGNQAFLALDTHGEVAGHTVEVHAQLTSFFLVITAGKQTCDDAGEHVTGTCRGHAGIAGGIEHDGAVG